MKDIKFDEKGLVPAVVQEGCSGKVLMVAYMNAESLKRTVDVERVTGRIALRNARPRDLAALVGMSYVSFSRFFKLRTGKTVMDYILDLVMATHADNPYIREGASPRAAQALIRTARARAFMENRLNVSFEDVKCVALPVLRHRILLSFDAVSEGITEDAVIGQILTEKEQGLYA